MFVPHRKHTYRPLRSATGIAVLSNMYIMFVPHRKIAYGPSQPAMGIALLFLDDVRTSPETRLWAFKACYGGSFTFLDDVRTSQETNLQTSTACY
jgi:hypothetical protein